MNISEALTPSDKLKGVSDSPELDLQVILSHVLQRNTAYLYTWPEKTLSEEEAQAFNVLLARRLEGEPVAFILGKKDFWSLELKVNASTLIPRPDTEILVETALKCIEDKPAHKILDLGTGTGAIALALASELPHSQVTGVDLSSDAVQLANANAKLNHLSNVLFMQSDWFDALPAQSSFDLIVSNPPYIADDDPALDEMVSKYEPQSALIAANEGMADIEIIVAGSKKFLSAEGWLCFEHGFEQGEKVQRTLKQAGFIKVKTIKDLAGHPRVTIGQYTS